MWNDIFASIDNFIESSKQQTQCVIITGEVSAGKTKMLKTLLDIRNIPKTFRPTSSIEAQTSIPLVIRQHNIWQLSLRNQTGLIRTLQVFPNRKDLTTDDVISGNYICLEGPFWDNINCTVEVLDLRGWNEKRYWEDEIEYLETVLDTKKVIGVVYVVKNERLQSARGIENLTEGLLLLHKQQKLVEAVTVIPVITHVKPTETDTILFCETGE